MDIKRIEALIKVVRESEVAEIAIRGNDSAVVVRKSPKNGVSAQPKKATQAKAKPKQAPKPEVPAPVVTAPMVGIFHVTDGTIAKGSILPYGQVVGAIESMKLMNDVLSTVEGEVDEVLVEDGMPVEFGQPLFRLKPEQREA